MKASVPMLIIAAADHRTARQFIETECGCPWRSDCKFPALRIATRDQDCCGYSAGTLFHMLLHNMRFVPQQSFDMITRHRRFVVLDFGTAMVEVRARLLETEL